MPPAHDDRNASLSISEGTDGTVLLKCHAGCETDEVCRALGIKLRDLFFRQSPSRPGEHRSKGA